MKDITDQRKMKLQGTVQAPVGWTFRITASFLFIATLNTAGRMTVGAQNVSGKVMEYCEAEQFTARCTSPDEIVLIKSAHFGRMRLGRCLTVNNGNLGCQLDVADQLESLCSGRRRCDVLVSSIDHSALPCTREVRGYLEASYVCVKVVTKRVSDCQKSSAAPEIRATSTDSSGFLASVVTEETGCGSLDTPWVVRASPGQTIRLRLLDFGTAGRDSAGRGSPGGGGQMSLTCQVYAVVKENNVARNSETVCSSDQRESLVYSSYTNQVEIRIVTAQKNHRSDYFAIKYEAVGCPDLESLEPDSPHWMQRSGDVAVFGCNGSAETWQLTCDGNRWTGDRRTCPSGTPSRTMALDTSIWNAFTSSQWAAIIIILIIAVTIGMVIFVIGLIYLKRARSRRLDRANGAGMAGGCGGCNSLIPDYNLALAADIQPLQSPSKSGGGAGGTMLPSPCGGQDPSQQPMSENDYFRTWQLQRNMMSGCPHAGGQPPSKHPSTSFQPPPPAAGFHQGDHRRPAPGSLRFAPPPQVPPLPPSSGRRVIPEHIYESPRLERREFAPATSTPVSSSAATGTAAAATPLECTCNCLVDARTGCGGPVNTTATVLMDCAGVTPIQYYELDQNSRPARV